MRERVRRFVLLVVVGASMAPAFSGDLSDWVAIPKPQDITIAPNARGTTAMFQTPGEVHLFSGISKQWTTILATAVDFAEQYHSHAIVQAGTSLHGFSSRTGVVETITVSANVVLVNGPINNCFVTLAIDGSTVHAFSGMRGKWKTLQVSGSNPTASSTGTIGLVRDGDLVHAFSAHHGEFVPVAADAAAQFVIATETATAHSPGVFRAFSAQQNSWATRSFPMTGISLVRSGYALATNGNDVLAFSGLSGDLATHSASTPIVAIEADTAVAAFVDGGDAVAYGAGRGAFAVLSGGASSSPLVDGDFAFFTDAKGVTPFSALTGAFGPKLFGGYALSTHESIGFADGIALDFAYSPLVNDWFVAPVTPLGPPILLRSVVVLPTATSYAAFSARSAEWVGLGVSVPLVYSASPDGATFVAHDGPNTAHVLDARIGRFETVHGSSALATSVFRNVFLAHDGATIWGYGQNAGRLQSLPLASPVVNVIPKTSIAIVETANELLVFSAKGSLSQEGRYPEYYLSVQLGNLLRLHQVAPPGAALVLFVGVKPAYLPLPGDQGVMFLDPNFVASTFPLGVMPASGILEIDLPLPDSPALVGMKPQIQNAVLPISGAPYLTTSVSPVLY